LEGLEATEILFSTLNDERRIDAQYFRKKYLEEDASRRHHKCTSLGEVAFITDGPHGYHIVDDQSGIAMLTAKCAKDWFADRAQAETIHIETHRSNLRSSLEANDLILSTRGTVGACALVEAEALPANIDQDVARISIARKGSVTPCYVVVYLNSRFGQDWIERNATGMVQQGLSLAKVRDLPIPVLSEKFQTIIDNLVQAASAARARSRSALLESESILLHALGLDTWTPPDALTYVRSSREAFAAGRLDAEHFQPRFAALAAKLAAIGNSERLGSQLLFNARGTQPEYADDGLPVVNSKHVLRNEVRYDDDNRRAVFDDDSLLIQTGDVLINGTGVGTIGRAAAYLHQSPALPDNHVTILRPNSTLDPVYLAIFLNSLAGQLQVDQRLRGSSGQIELYPTDIAEFQVWVAPKSLQLEIRSLVEQSYAQRQRATRLLDAAKRAVEIAIEDSEAAALAYLAAANPSETAA
jgi:type I restriction enzyme M protein